MSASTSRRHGILAFAVAFLMLSAAAQPVHGQSILLVSTEPGVPGEMVHAASG